MEYKQFSSLPDIYDPVVHRRKIIKNSYILKSPWLPKQRIPPYIPVKKTFTPVVFNKAETNQSLYRLWILFPTIGFQTIGKILETHGYNFNKTIDSLLYLQMIQQTRDNYQNCRRGPYNRTATRCVPNDFAHPGGLPDQNLFENDFGMFRHIRTTHPNITIDNAHRNVIYNFDFTFHPIDPASSYVASTFRAVSDVINLYNMDRQMNDNLSNNNLRNENDDNNNLLIVDQNNKHNRNLLLENVDEEPLNVIVDDEHVDQNQNTQTLQLDQNEQAVNFDQNRQRVNFSRNQNSKTSNHCPIRIKLFKKRGKYNSKLV